MSDTTDLEDRITAGLGHRAAQVDPPRTSISSVRDAARRHRAARTRRRVGLTAATAGAIFVVAVAVVPQLTGVRAPEQTEPAGPSTSAADPGTTDSRVDQGLPQGPAPRVPFVVGDEYRTPDGGVRDLELPGQSGRSGVSAVTPFEGGALVADGLFFEGTNGLFLVDGDATMEVGPCASGTGVSSDDQRTLAYATFACPETGDPAPLTVKLTTADGVTESFEVPTDPNTNTLATVAGLLGSSVVLNLDDEVVVARPGGIMTAVPDATNAIDVSGDLAIVTSADGRTRVVDLSNGLATLNTDNTLSSFSPSGERVLEQVGNRTLIVKDAITGETAQEFGLPRSMPATDIVWEDDDHLLYTLESAAGTSIVRIQLGPDLGLERAGAFFSADERVVLPSGSP